MGRRGRGRSRRRSAPTADLNPRAGGTPRGGRGQATGWGRGQGRCRGVQKWSTASSSNVSLSSGRGAAVCSRARSSLLVHPVLSTLSRARRVRVWSIPPYIESVNNVHAFMTAEVSDRCWTHGRRVLRPDAAAVQFDFGRRRLPDVLTAGRSIRRGGGRLGGAEQHEILTAPGEVDSPWPPARGLGDGRVVQVRGVGDEAGDEMAEAEARARP